MYSDIVIYQKYIFPPNQPCFVWLYFYRTC